jgi:mannose-1-phosphate guanylyltransferase/phosphomannomutase
VKAVIMAGGEGTRLRPLTSNSPKPMMPLVNRPMMEHVVELLRKHGFDEIVVTVAFMANVIRNYFGDGSEFGVKMVYASEDTPLGTAGSVRNAMEQLDDTFLVISGDVLTDVDLGSIVEQHRRTGAMATIGLVAVENPLEFGIVITREDGSIERFLEKPDWGEVFTDTINTGIYVLEPQIFDYIEADRPVDFSSEVFPQLLAEGKPLYGAVAQGYWEDVGTLDAYGRAHQDILDGKVQLTIPGFEVSDGVWVGEGAEVHPDAIVHGPAVIGDNAFVDAGAVLGEYVVLGTGARLGANSELERTVVGDNAYIGESVKLRGTIVGRSSDLRRSVRCEEGVVLGDEVFVGEDAVIAANVKVYPFKTVEANAVINSSIVWESKGARSLFGRDGVMGLANVDMTPELATKVALAFATSLKKDATVVVSRDSSRSARMLKRALMAGLNAGGVNVLDLEVATVPVTRFVCRQANVSAGITLRLAEGDPDQVLIRFFDKDGADQQPEVRRKIERLFAREDFRRVRPADIGEIGLPPRALEQYAVTLESIVDIPTIAAQGFKVVLDYGYGSASLAMPSVLAKLGAEVLVVNPFTSTAGMLEFDRDERAAAVAKLVVASGADLGAVIDPAGEQLTLVDDAGHVLTSGEALYCLLDLVTDRMVGDRVALPVAASRHAADMLESRGFSVRWTKMTAVDLASASEEPGVGFAADLDGGFIIPGFIPAIDGVAAFVKVLDLLAVRREPLSKLVAGVPPMHIVHERVVTPWESKGTVMRSLVEQNKGRDVELVDGVKVFHDRGWALMLPDPEEPLTHIWAEGDTAAEARSLAQEYSRRVRQMAR